MALSSIFLGLHFEPSWWKSSGSLNYLLFLEIWNSYHRKLINFAYQSTLVLGYSLPFPAIKESFNPTSFLCKLSSTLHVLMTKIWVWMSIILSLYLFIKSMCVHQITRLLYLVYPWTERSTYSVLPSHFQAFLNILFPGENVMSWMYQPLCVHHRCLSVSCFALPEPLQQVVQNWIQYDRWSEWSKNADRVESWKWRQLFIFVQRA